MMVAGGVLRPGEDVMRLFARATAALSVIAASIAAGAAWAQIPMSDPAAGGIVMVMLAAAVRTVEYASLFAAAGGGVFLVQAVGNDMLLARRLQPGLLWLVLTAGMASVVDVGLHGARLSAGIVGLVAGEAWIAGLASARGLGASVLLIGLGLLALGISAHGRRGAVAASLAGAAIAAAAVGLGRQTAVDGFSSFCVLLAALHAAAAGLIIGTLWPLIVTLTTQPTIRSSEVVRRMAWPVLTGAALIILSGALLSPVSPADDTRGSATPYGVLWLAKLSVGILTVSFAFLRFRQLVPALHAHRPGAERRLRANLIYAGGMLAAMILLGVLLELVQTPFMISGATQ